MCCCWRESPWLPVQMPPEVERGKKRYQSRRFEEFMSRLAGYGGFSFLDIKMQNVFYILMWMLAGLKRRECGKTWISRPFGPRKWSTHCRTLDTNENMAKEREKEHQRWLVDFRLPHRNFRNSIRLGMLRIIPAGIHFWINQIVLAMWPGLDISAVSSLFLIRLNETTCSA